MSSPTQTQRVAPPWLGLVQSQIESLRFGVVQVVVHDSRVIQIERTEKFRFDKGGQPAPAPTLVIHSVPGAAEAQRSVTQGSKFHS
jgi:hypothetical protein